MSLITIGETIPRINAGIRNKMAVSNTMRSNRGREMTHAGASVAKGSISRVVAAPASMISPRLLRDAARSANTPPSQLPMLMPARITPMTLVHVYTETPMWGASILAATISMIRVTALAVNTMAYGSSARSHLMGCGGVVMQPFPIPTTKDSRSDPGFVAAYGGVD